MLRSLVFAASAAAVLASCPNQCSGHGYCGENDQCVCFKQNGLYNPLREAWTGADCSQRKCPVGPAYAGISTSRPAVTDLQFSSASSLSNSKLSVMFVPSAQDAAYKNLRSDRKFIVQVMSKTQLATNPVTYDFTFAVRTELDEFFQPEAAAQDYLQATRAYAVTTADGSSSGVFVYWDPVKDDTPDFRSTTTEVAVGDRYTFTLRYNDGGYFIAGDANTAHQAVECSGVGKCDTETGTCKCAPGFSGDACQRTLCPKGCSGHGSCQTQARMATAGMSVNSVAYAGAYEKDQQYGCVCDAGYRGADCSQMECPSSYDVMGGDGGAEGRDCSGRGSCDYSSGTCKCFKGFFGRQCESQSVLV